MSVAWRKSISGCFAGERSDPYNDCYSAPQVALSHHIINHGERWPFLSVVQSHRLSLRQVSHPLGNYWPTAANDPAFDRDHCARRGDAALHDVLMILVLRRHKTSGNHSDQPEGSK